MTITDSTFTGNMGYNGGTIATNGWGRNDVGVVLSVTGSTFSQNTATAPAITGSDNGGGGIYLSGGSTGTVTDSSFSGNQSANGGAIFSFPEGSGSTHIDQSTFDGNVSTNRGQGGAIYHQSATGNGALTIDNASNCPVTDQRGFARYGPCDIGAYEFGGGILINSLNPPWSGLNEMRDIILVVQGVGFGPNSVVRWEGLDKATTAVLELPTRSDFHNRISFVWICRRQVCLLIFSNRTQA